MCILSTILTNNCRANIAIKRNKLDSIPALNKTSTTLLDVSLRECFLATTGKGITQLDFLVLRRTFQAGSYLISL